MNTREGFTICISENVKTVFFWHREISLFSQAGIALDDGGQPVISPIRKKKGGNTQSVVDHDAEKKQVMHSTNQTDPFP